MVRIFSIFFFFVTYISFSQGEANNWYFGYGAGITFNSGSPVAVTNGVLYTNEGCATISDSAGQLLFYTDGITVYNRNHLMMLNGDSLNGDTSSSQSATIVPKPGSTTLFYIFTVDAEARPNGLQYSVVDMTLDGGFGAVTSEKNVLIYTPSCEKIGVVKHANNTDFWIVSHGWNNNSFYAHLLTASGLSTIPITSSVGAVHGLNTLGETYSSEGYLRISPNGSKLAICSIWSGGTTQLFDFNNASGAITNPKTIQIGTDLFYGAEFSTNNEVLFLSSPVNDRIYQFDLNASNPVLSASIVYTGAKKPCALQLGPDGKIYVAFPFQGFVGVINNPNVLGLGCNVNDNAIFLEGKECEFGLPPFITSYFYTPAIQLNNLCQNEISTFELNTNQVITSAFWNFGDGATSTAIQPNHAYANPGNYTVTVTVVGPNGTGNNTRNIIIYPQPALLTNTVTLKQCDDNNDGYSAFNLNETIPLLVSNPTGLTITFHETLTQAQDESAAIANVTSYTNQIINNDIVYVRVENATGCYKTAQINLQVSTTSLPTTFQLTYHECDDVISGSNTDGTATFNFSDAESQVRALYPSGQLLDVTFYKNLADALSESNKITNTSNYINTGYPNTQNIYVRVDSQVNNECLGLGHHITLKVDRIPIVLPQVVRHCDDDQDGSFAFDTINLQTNLLSGLSNVVVTYSDLSGNPITMSNPFISTSQTINVKVKNTFGKLCEYNTTIQFIVDDLPQAYAIPTVLTTVCDDETNPALQNGSYSFDTSTFQSTILGSQTGMIVNYFDANNNPLSSPLPNPFVTTQLNISVEVINPNNSSCKATMTIPFVINPVPNINLYGNELICSDNPSFTKVINAGLVDTSTISNYNYTWFLNNNLIPSEIQYSLTVNTEGIYTVEVKNAQGCTRTRTITVTASNLAIIDSIVVNDLVGENSIMVLLSSASLGDYVYSLDNSNYQTSNLFLNIMPGVYTAYVKDLKGCGITPKEVSVLGIPKYFTPNEDGFNDYWNIDGVNQNFYSKSTIHIFDRYGKLLKQISPLSQGWDGKFNGQNSPSDDYWYVNKIR